MTTSSTQSEITHLVRRAQAGDGAAFNQIVRRYQDMAVGYARSFLGRFDLAEDAAQEAFLDAYRNLTALQEPATFAAWLRKIVFKHCDRITRRATIPTISIETAAEIPSSHSSPHAQVERQDVRSHVRAAIQALPDAEREAVLLFYIAEYSQRDIAEFLDITPNTVKTRLYSARRRLKERMIPMVQDDLHAQRPSRNDQFADRVLTSTLPLQVYVREDRTQKFEPAGTTAGLRTAALPAARLWFLKPTGNLSDEDWDRVIDLMESHAIPGLEVTDTFTDRHLQRLARLGNLLYLNLNSSQVTDAGLQALAGLPNLEHLGLSGCKGITDAGLGALSSTPRLTHFHADHHQGITDVGIARLSNHLYLENVSLLGTRTGDSSLAALTGKPNLTHLSLGSDVTDAGLARLPEFPAFRTWRNGTPAPEMSLMSASAHPSFVMLNLKAPVTDAGLAHFAGLDGLFAVSLFGTTGSRVFDDSASTVSATGIAHLAKMANLGWLGCCAGKCTDDVMAQIGSMPRLRFLMCQDTVAGDAGFEALAKSQTIQHIWGRRCYHLGNRGFAALAHMPALSGLAVSCRHVDDIGLSALPTFPALRELMPIDVTDDGFVHVGRCQKLDTLEAMYCPEMTDAATSHIRSLPLKTYRVWGARITDRTLEILGGMASLERLLFYKCGITDHGLAHLAKLPRLQHLALESLEKVTEAGLAQFAASVQVSYEP